VGLVKGTLAAVFQDGVFRPVRRPDLPEGERVRLTVESVGQASLADVVELATRVYEGLSPTDIDEIDEMARRRRASSCL
jgi:predicted DNA-binding antitoxin AbrB/MazE fold protein